MASIKSIKKTAARIFPLFFWPVAFFLLVGWADTWEGLKETAGSIETVQAEFVQEKHLEILNKPLISTGSLYFKAPGSLRWEYASPFESVLLMHKGNVARFVKGEDGFARDEGTRLQAMQIVMDEISMWLGGNFRDNPDFEASLKPGPVIVLTPKNEGFAAIIQRIELALSQIPGLIETVTIYESKTSFTRLAFTNERLNQPIPDSVFEKIQ